MLLSWTDYYDGSGTEYSQKTGRLSSFSGNAYIKNCFFKGLSSPSAPGGSIYLLTSSNLLMLIESCTFINSQTPYCGGAIYFSSNQFVMVKVCGYGCKSTSSDYQFGYVRVTDNIGSKNENHDSVICGTTQTSKNYELSHYNGKVVVKQTNFSSNLCRQISTIYSNPSSNGNYFASSLSFKMDTSLCSALTNKLDNL